MFPDLSPLLYLAILGMVALFLVIIPAFGAGVAILVWRVITTEWSTYAAMIGAGVGLLPGAAFMVDIAATYLRRLK